MKKYFLGGDVSKGYADFIVLDSEKNIVENNFQLDDTFNGHNQLYSILVDFYKEHPNASILSTVESTGGYENNWLNTLSKLAAIGCVMHKILRIVYGMLKKQTKL